MNWLERRDPDSEQGALCARAVGPAIGTEERRKAHHELVPFFLADTGPRGELALPADTSLLDTVAEFRARWVVLPAMGLGIIAATIRQASIELDVAWTVVNDRIAAMAASSPEGPLLPTVPRQLGIDLPLG